MQIIFMILFTISCLSAEDALFFQVSREKDGVVYLVEKESFKDLDKAIISYKTKIIKKDNINLFNLQIDSENELEAAINAGAYFMMDQEKLRPFYLNEVVGSKNYKIEKKMTKEINDKILERLMIINGATKEMVEGFRNFKKEEK